MAKPVYEWIAAGEEWSEPWGGSARAMVWQHSASNPRLFAGEDDPRDRLGVWALE